MERTKRAASDAVSTREGATQPEHWLKNAGKVGELKEATATPNVSKTSSVRGISSTDFTPAQTTHILVRLNSVRSANRAEVTICQKLPTESDAVATDINTCYP